MWCNNVTVLMWVFKPNYVATRLHIKRLFPPLMM